MIYRNGELITQLHIGSLVKEVASIVQRDIGAVYKGTQLIWLTVYNAIRSCFGSGAWIKDKPWLDDDSWKNN